MVLNERTHTFSFCTLFAFGIVVQTTTNSTKENWNKMCGSTTDSTNPKCSSTTDSTSNTISETKIITAPGTARYSISEYDNKKVSGTTPSTDTSVTHTGKKMNECHTSSMTCANRSNMSVTSDYFSAQNTEKIECKYSEGNTIITCTEVQPEKTESIFNKDSVPKKEEEIELGKNIFLHASECVEMLDAIPFESEEVDDDEINYYDSLLNI